MSLLRILPFVFLGRRKVKTGLLGICLIDCKTDSTQIPSEPVRICHVDTYQ